VGKSALVTGACGFVGSHVVEQLVEEGWEVVATDLEAAGREAYYVAESVDGNSDQPRHRYYGSLLDDLGVAFVPADLTDASTLEPLFDRPGSYDAVFHTASLFDYLAEWERLRAVNVEGGHTIGRLAADHGVGHFVHWSTLGVCGGTDPDRRRPAGEDVPPDPGNPYERSKAEQERVLRRLHRRNDLPLTVLRPAPVYGPRHSYGLYHLLLFYRKLGTGLVVPIYPRRRQLRFPSVHVTDVVRAALFAVRNHDRTDGEVYNVTSEPLPQDELVEFVAEALGLPTRRVPLPWRLYRTVAGWLAATAERFERRARARNAAPKFPASMAQYLVSDFWFTSEKLETAGFDFRYENPREGLWEYVSWCKRRGLL